MDAKLTGGIIAQKRKEKGLNQIQLAKQLNVSNRTVSKWETGDGFPDITLLPEISAVLGITIDELLTGVKPCPPDSAGNDELRKKLKNEFKIFFIISFSFAVFSAVLGCVTEAYNIWAFGGILFYNHWEIIFSAVSLFTSVLSAVSLVAGLTRMRLEYSRSELIGLYGKRMASVSFVLSLFPLAFIARIIGVSRYGLFTPYIMAAVLAAVAAGTVLAVKKLKGVQGSEEKSD